MLVMLVHSSMCISRYLFLGSSPACQLVQPSVLSLSQKITLEELKETEDDTFQIQPIHTSVITLIF